MLALLAYLCFLYSPNLAELIIIILILWSIFLSFSQKMCSDILNFNHSYLYRQMRKQAREERNIILEKIPLDPVGI